MRNCQEKTQEVERSNFEKLSLKKRLLLKAHCLLCPPCRSYFKDSKSIDKILTMRYSDFVNYEYSVEEKNELKNRLGD